MSMRLCTINRYYFLVLYIESKWCSIAATCVWSRIRSCCALSDVFLTCVLTKPLRYCVPFQPVFNDYYVTMQWHNTVLHSTLPLLTHQQHTHTHTHIDTYMYICMHNTCALLINFKYMYYIQCCCIYFPPASLWKLHLNLSSNKN